MKLKKYKVGITYFIVAIILAFVWYYLLPFWWSSVPSSIFCGFWLAKSSWRAFAFGFLSNAFTWFILIMLKTMPNQNILAVKMANLFHVLNWQFLIILCLVVVGVLSGLISSTSFFAKQVILSFTSTNKKP